MALTCKAFQDPGLDVIWREFRSMEQIVGCLPDDLLTVVEEPSRVENLRFEILNLSRPLRSADLTRYMTNYAHRIRVFNLSLPSLGRVNALFSPATFQALQTVSRGVRGAFAPNLTDFTWPHQYITHVHAAIGDRFSAPFAAAMSFFLGESVARLRLPADPVLETPATLTAMLFALESLPLLKHLDLSLRRTLPAMRNFLEASQFSHLENLNIAVASAPIVSRIASLPRLSRLSVDIPADVAASTSPLYPMASDHFPALIHLQLRSNSAAHVAAFIKSVPPHNSIESLKLYTDNATLEEARNTLDAIRLHMNPATLRRLLWDEESHWSLGAAGMEVDMDNVLSVSALLRFKRLEEISISTRRRVQPTPGDIQQIPVVWPNIRTLDFHEKEMDNIPPLIDHTHVLSILEGCPSLTTLGLRFDASRITGGEKSPLAPFALEGIYLDVAPIYAPSRVLKFLKSNLSDGIKILNAEDYSGDEPEDEETINFIDRWTRVVREWSKGSENPAP